MSIFKAYDVRGIFNKDLTEDIVLKIGQLLGKIIKEKNLPLVMAVGRDGRESSLPLFNALSAGLVQVGITVKSVGVVPTPLLYFAAFTKVHGNGIMITGSHNPPQYNGLKITLDYQPFFDQALKNLEKRLSETQEDSFIPVGLIEHIDVVDSYIERIVSDFHRPKPFKPLKLVIDAGNGVAGLVAPKLYRALGYEIVEQFCEVDSSFPNHHPDPADPHNLEDLIKSVKKHNADLGFAFDGDGDRLGVVTPSGEIIYPDRQLILFIRDVLKQVPKSPIVFDVKCSAWVKKEIEALGGKPVIYKTGHSWIKTHMKQIHSPLGGEMSGHLFFNHRWYGFDDAIYSGARLLEIIGSQSNPGHYLESLPKGYSTPELKWEFSNEGEQHKLIQTLQSFIQQKTQLFSSDTLSKYGLSKATIEMIDGVRVDFQEGFGLIRASNTTPTVILRFEGDSSNILEKIKLLFKDILSNIVPNTSLPI